MRLIATAAMLVLAGCGGADDGASDGLPRGVTADSIKIGSHTDLSGNLAIWGVPATNGQRMRNLPIPTSINSFVNDCAYTAIYIFSMRMFMFLIYTLLLLL